MSKKISPLQIFSFVVIAGLLGIIIFLQRSQASQQIPLPVPNTGSASSSVEPTLSSKNNTLITLADNTKIELVPGTIMEIISEPGLPAGSKEIVLNLVKGDLLVIPKEDGTSLVKVQTAKGYNASIQGCSAAVSFSQMDDSFKLDCISGQCDLGSKVDEHLKADAGMTWSFFGGVFMNPQAIDASALKTKFSSVIPDCKLVVPVTGGATETPKPTYTVTPTLTMTPAPSVTLQVPVTGGTARPNLGATATAACADFHSKFPATPCPK